MYKTIHLIIYHRSTRSVGRAGITGVVVFLYRLPLKQTDPYNLMEIIFIFFETNVHLSHPLPGARYQRLASSVRSVSQTADHLLREHRAHRADRASAGIGS